MVHTLRAPPSTILCSHSQHLYLLVTASQSALFGSQVTLLQQLPHTTLSRTTLLTLTLTASHSALTLRTSQDLLAQVKTCWAHLMLPLGKNKKNAEMSSPTRLPTLSYRPQRRTPSFPLFGPQPHHSRSHNLQSLFVGFLGGIWLLLESTMFPPLLPATSLSLDSANSLLFLCVSADTPPFPHMSHPVSPICQKFILFFHTARSGRSAPSRGGRTGSRHGLRTNTRKDNAFLTRGGNGVRRVGKKGGVSANETALFCAARGGPCGRLDFSLRCGDRGRGAQLDSGTRRTETQRAAHAGEITKTKKQELISYLWGKRGGTYGEKGGGGRRIK